MRACQVVCLFAWYLYWNVSSTLWTIYCIFHSSDLSFTFFFFSFFVPWFIVYILNFTWSFSYNVQLVRLQYHFVACNQFWNWLNDPCSALNNFNCLSVCFSFSFHSLAHQFFENSSIEPLHTFVLRIFSRRRNSIHFVSIHCSFRPLALMNKLMTIFVSE